MEGPYVLLPDKIDEQITSRTPGNFALGYIVDTDFIVLFIGRADDNLNAELKDFVFWRSDCLFFKYSVAKSPQEAFEKECINYHDFGESTNLRNVQHPEPAPNMNWKCPGCLKFG